MILRLFSGGRFVNAFLIVLLSLLLWLPSFLGPERIDFIGPAQPMPFYAYLAGLFKDSFFLARGFSLLFILIQAFLLVRLNGRYILIQDRNFMPAFFFIVLTSFYEPLLNFSSLLFGSFFFIFLLDLLFSVYKKEANSYRFFEAGLLLGIGSLFYSRLIYFLPFIWVASLILRPFYWREWLFPVLGLILPYLFYIAGYFLADKDPLYIIDLLLNNLQHYQYSFTFNWQSMIPFGYSALLIFIASIYMLRVFQFRKVYIRQYYLVFFWLFVFAAIYFFVLKKSGLGLIYIMGIPVAYILSNYFMNSKKSFGNRLLFFLLLILALLNMLNNVYGWV